MHTYKYKYIDTYIQMLYSHISRFTSTFMHIYM